MGIVKGIIFDWVGTLYQFDDLGLFPQSREVLDELKNRGYKMSLVSKATADKVQSRNYQINPLRAYFKTVVVDVEKTPNQFFRCMKSMQSLPKNTLVVDDRADNGLRLGNSIGCLTAWVQNGKYSNIMPDDKTGEPDFYLNSIEDLLKVLPNERRT